MKKIFKDLTPLGILSMATLMDKLLFFLLIILTLSSFFFAKKLIHPGNLVKISSDNKTIYMLSLDEEKTVSVKGKLGDSVVEIKNSKVRMKESPCPNKLCIHQGWLDSGAIICLPNKKPTTQNHPKHFI
ncbi:MAG: NusG domain II-containing protein [Nitrospirae bacterium]|nr:NusG domain II-containing protein [Nitrospirota bacterium]